MATDEPDALLAPVRMDLAGGFTDNVAFLRNVPSYLASVTFSPCVRDCGHGPGTHPYVNGSGLAVSTALNALEWIRQAGGRPYLAATPLETIADALCDYENGKYAITVGKGDAYPVIFGGFRCWRCQGLEVRRVPFDIHRDTLDRLEKGILLLYSGVPRESTESLEQFNRNFDSGQTRFAEAFAALKASAFDCGVRLAAGDVGAVGAILNQNWDAQKILAPAVTNAYLDDIHACALQSGAVGGKLSGAGGGGYFIFCARDPEALASALTNRFPLCQPQPFRFVHDSIKALNGIPDADLR